MIIIFYAFTVAIKEAGWSTIQPSDFFLNFSIFPYGALLIKEIYTVLKLPRPLSPLKGRFILNVTFKVKNYIFLTMIQCGGLIFIFFFKELKICFSCC